MMQKAWKNNTFVGKNRFSALCAIHHAVVHRVHDVIRRVHHVRQAVSAKINNGMVDEMTDEARHLPVGFGAHGAPYLVNASRSKAKSILFASLIAGTLAVNEPAFANDTVIIDWQQYTLQQVEDDANLFAQLTPAQFDKYMLWSESQLESYDAIQAQENAKQSQLDKSIAQENAIQAQENAIQAQENAIQAQENAKQSQLDKSIAQENAIQAQENAKQSQLDKSIAQSKQRQEIIKQLTKRYQQVQIIVDVLNKKKSSGSEVSNAFLDIANDTTLNISEATRNDYRLLSEATKDGAQFDDLSEKMNTAFFSLATAIKSEINRLNDPSNTEGLMKAISFIENQTQ